MSSFKGWLLTENIIIQDMGHEAVLQVVPANYLREFNYQFDKGYSSYFIAPYQARRQGYLHISSTPTHLGITKTTAIEGSMGVDISFIKTLTKILGTKFPSVPYKETGDSDWADMFKKAAPDLELNPQDDKEFGHGPTPQFGKNISNSMQLTPGIRASRASGSWSYFIKTSSPEYIVKAVIEAMKQAAQPLLDNNLIDYYDVVDRMTQKRLEVVRSSKGEEAQNNHTKNYQENVGYIKYLAMVLLKNHPGAQKLVLNRINGVGVKVSGGGAHPAAAVTPNNNKIPLPAVQRFIKDYFADDYVLGAFVEAAKKDNELIYKILERASKEQNPNTLIFYSTSLLKTEGYSDFGEDLSHILEGDGMLHGVIRGMYTALKIFEQEKGLSELIPHQFDSFKSKYEKALNEHLLSEEEKYPLSHNELETLKKLAEYIKIDPRVLAQIDQLHADSTKQRDEQQKRETEARSKATFMMYDGSSKYMVLSEGMTEWKNIPDRYISHYGDIDLGEFALSEIIDRSDVAEEAYERAMEKAQEYVEEKPSINYGNDAKEVESDIESDYDEFINDESLEDEGLEDMSDEEAMQLVKDKYFSDFIAWKKAKLEEQEEEENWKYEAQPEDKDIWEAEEEIAAEIVHKEYGLVTVQMNQKGGLDFELHSKFKEKFQPILIKTIKINTETKDPEFKEPLLSYNATVRIDYVDREKAVAGTPRSFLGNPS